MKFLCFLPIISGTMGSDSESEGKEEKVKTRQPSASSRKVAPDFQGHCPCDNKYSHQDIKVEDHHKLRIKCPNCLEDIKTKKIYKTGDYSKQCACNILIQTMYFTGICCTWMPYTFRNCKDVYHKCPRCKHRLVMWRRDYCTCCSCCKCFCGETCCYAPDRYGLWSKNTN